MTAKSNAMTGLIGTGMAAAPSVVDKPFYESDLWLSAVAIMGMVVLVLTAINAIVSLKKQLKKRGK
jgi:hypothetical protein